MKKYLVIGTILVVLFLVCAVSAMADLTSNTFTSEDGCLVHYRVTDDYTLIFGQAGREEYIKNTGAGIYGYLDWSASDKYVPWRNGYRDTIKAVRFEGTVHIIGSMKSFFYNYSSLESVNFANCDTSGVTTMHSLFSRDDKLKTVSNLDKLVTNSVTDMAYMFSGCHELTSVDVSKLNTANVTTMASMFDECRKVTALDVSHFNTSNVTDMSSMFSECATLTALDVSGFDTRKVTKMSWMFGGSDSQDGCKGLTSLAVANFNTANVTDMYGMFRRCSGLTSLNLSSWNVSKTTNMGYLFAGCSGLTSLNVSGWNTSSVTNFTHFLQNCSSLPSVNLSHFNTENGEYFWNMFQNCSSLTSLDVGNFDTSNAVQLGSMFSGCSNLEFLNIAMLNPVKATYMTGMFNSDSKLKEVVLGQHNPFVGSGVTVTLPTPPYGEVNGVRYTGKWVREDGVYGPYTPTALRDNYTSDMAGTWTWERAATTYTISFKNIDGEGTMADVKPESGEDYTLPRCTFTKAKHVFDHWYDGRGNTYNDQAVILANTFAVGASVTLTATYTSKFTLNFVSFESASGSMASERPDAVKAYTIPNNGFVVEGKAFDYWDDGRGHHYGANAQIPADTYTVNDEVTLTAMFRAAEYTLVFVPSEQQTIGSLPNVTKDISEAYELPQSPYRLAGYQFDHWEDEFGNQFANKATIPANTYVNGGTVVLTGVMVPRDTSVHMQNGAFEFSIYGDEKAFFDGIPAGTAYYVSENVPEDWVLIMQSNAAGIIYPLEEAEALFVNKYQPGIAMAQFVGRKLIDEQPAEADRFAFELWEGNILLQTKSVIDGGFIMFDAIQYDKNDAGLHKYTIKEVVGDDGSVLYDHHEEIVLVQVTAVTENDGTTKVSTEVTYDDDNVIFKNWTKPGELTLKKLVDDLLREHEGDQFTFRITFKQENGLPLEESLTYRIQ